MSEPIAAYSVDDFRRNSVGELAAQQVELPCGAGSFSLIGHEKTVCIVALTAAELAEQYLNTKLFGRVERLRQFPIRAIVLDVDEGVQHQATRATEIAASAAVPVLCRFGSEAVAVTVGRLLKLAASRIERGMA